MAWRIEENVTRGEIDNRTKGVVRGRIWLHGRPNPLELDLEGNAHPDLAGCLLTFENPSPTTPHPHLDGLVTDQTGTIGDLTASRKVRVFDLPFEEAYAQIQRGERPSEHLANCLYLEWYSQRNGRVVVESTEYRLQISEPAWRPTPEEEQRRAEESAAGFAGFLGRLTEAVDQAKTDVPEDRALDEFEWEKAFRESDAVADKVGELHDKFGEHPDFEEILAKEMGWDDEEEETVSFESFDETGEGRLSVEEINEITAEAIAHPLQPRPETEGVDWVRDAEGRISHPLVRRILERGLELWHWCNDRGLLNHDDEPDLPEMIFQFECCGAKCAGALGRLPYDDPRAEGGFIVAALKRALAKLHLSLAAAERVKANGTLPAEKLDPFRAELLAVREEILGLMTRFRGPTGAQEDAF